MADPAPPVDPDAALAAQAARRRSPVERKVSRYSGSLLLVMFVQAAFGYALVVPPSAWWTYDVHLLLGLAVSVLAVLAGLAARRLEVFGLRERLLRAALPLVGALALVQFVLGYLTTSVAVPLDTRNAHIGLGLLLTFLIVGSHVLAILPSLLLSARREHARSLERLGRP